jgi:hypothetical protein
MKCEFYEHPLVYLGYAIGWWDLHIDPTNMEVILKWITNVNEFRIFVGEKHTYGSLLNPF